MKKNINSFKIIKICELCLFLALEVAFLVILISNKTMRSSIFVDKSLFILCSLMYFTVLCTVGILIVDFIKLRELKIENHKLENIAYFDKKTGIPNRTSVNLLFENYKTLESMKGICCVVTEISNIKEINIENGKAIGDKAIQDFSKMYEASAESFGFVGRNGGNEFIAVIENCDDNKANDFFKTLDDKVSAYNERNPKSALKVHSEHVLFDKEEVNSFSDLVAKAYQKLGR